MKTFTLIILLSLAHLVSSQSLSVTYSFDGGDPLGNIDNQSETKFSDPAHSQALTTVYFKIETPATGIKSFEIFDGNGAIIPASVIKDDGSKTLVTFPSNILNTEYEIHESDGIGNKVPGTSLVMKFTFVYDPVNNTNVTSTILPDIYSQMRPLLSTLTNTKLGLMDSDGRIHLIFDQYGNSLASTLPQGVATREYVTHIFYLDELDNPKSRYSVKQSKGGFYDGLILENVGANNFQVQSSTVTSNTVWKLHTQSIRPSNKDDLEFEIRKTNFDTGKTASVGSYSMNIVPSYHATFNIGLLYTDLENPTFEMINLTDTTSTVKKTNAGGTGIVAITATLYSSPMIWIERIFASSDNRKRELDAKLASRNYFDDHKWFEKIYPTVGIKLGEKSFENLLFGLNFEFARGGNIFLGGHLGKTNTFSGEFEFGVDEIEANDFNLRTNQSWNWGMSYGLNLDLRIVQNLFKSN